MITSITGFIAAWAASKWLRWVVTALGWAWWALKTFVMGMLSFLQDPRETFAVVAIAAIVFAVGIRVGVNWDAHLVRKAQTLALTGGEALGPPAPAPARKVVRRKVKEPSPPSSLEAEFQRLFGK